MNRETKRKLEKKIKRKLTAMDIHMIESLGGIKAQSPLVDGEKIRLDYYRITTQPNYENFNPKFKEFVENHKDAELTASVPNNYKKNGLICHILEDDSEIQWIFNINDLIRKEEDENV